MSSPSDNIAFVLVPPSFSPSSFYDRVVPLLNKKGYAAYPTDLKSVNDGEGAPVSMYEDAAEIGSVIARLVDQGKGVVLVANSYGGIPATQAAKGLSKAEREAVSKPGGLVAIIYLSSFIAPDGGCINDLMAGKMPENTKQPEDYHTMDPKTDAEYIFTHLSNDEKADYAYRLKKHSSRTFDDRLTHIGYLHVPSTYVIATDDLIVTPDFAKSMVNAANRKGANIVLKEIYSDHCPMISHAEDVVKILVQAAEDGNNLLYL